MNVGTDGGFVFGRERRWREAEPVAAGNCECGTLKSGWDCGTVKLEGFQERFMRELGMIQEECVQRVWSRVRGEAALDEALYDVTFKTIVGVMELLDGYRGGDLGSDQGVFVRMSANGEAFVSVVVGGDRKVVVYLQ